jgi:hypothetical protein
MTIADADATDPDAERDPLEDSRPPGAGTKEGSAKTGRERPFDEEPQTADVADETVDPDAPGRWIVDPDSGPPPEPNEPA